MSRVCDLFHARANAVPRNAGARQPRVRVVTGPTLATPNLPRIPDNRRIRMRRPVARSVCLSFLVLMSFAWNAGARGAEEHELVGRDLQSAREGRSAEPDLLLEGRHTFRFETFGDEAFWGDTLRLHQAIEGSRFGGVGAGVSPKTALAVGLKVDVDALPGSLIQALRRGQVNLDDPATTLALLKLNAVIGVTGFFTPGGTSLRSVGIQCALCHSAVDNSLAPGIGHRLDGWANRDLNVGAIVGLAPDLSTVATLLRVDE